jgi:two-component system sensor histidine kinase BaeS
MIRLVGSLLTLARADAGQVVMHREPVDLGRLVRDAVGHVEPEATRTGTAISVQADEGVYVTADPDLMLQLTLNLLDNAVKYTQDNGAVTVSCKRNGTHAEIVVSDTGPGIAAEHLPLIFDRFYRVDKARSRGDGGAGLGLSICRWIAEAHGGSIGVESNPSAGATFTVRLPAN